MFWEHFKVVVKINHGIFKWMAVTAGTEKMGMMRQLPALRTLFRIMNSRCIVGVSNCCGSATTFSWSAGDLLLRREVEADSEGWPLFPVEIIETNPYPESVCGAEHGRGC